LNQSVGHEDGKVESIKRNPNLGILNKLQMMKLNVDLDLSMANAT
jgi:hypothetical protein